MYIATSFHTTRIAPTPSGYLHLGNAASFLQTVVLAKQYNANILLRIDDMDSHRAESRYLEDIFETLHFLEINWQLGPRDTEDQTSNYSQHRRLPLYQRALDNLRQKGAVYACNCSRTQVLARNGSGHYDGHCRHRELSLDEKDVAWRLDTSASSGTFMKTITGVHKADFPAGMRDFVVRKKDGFPAYQLSSVVDDLHFGIDLIVRGQDLWSSTLAQLYLAQQLNEPTFGDITFHHHPLLLDAQQNKLSKSAGDISVRALRQKGYDAARIRQLIREQTSGPGWVPLP